MLINRRSFGRYAIGLTPISRSFAAEESNGVYSDPAIADTWMVDWMKSQARKPNGALHVLRFSDAIYCLTRQIGWLPNNDQLDSKAVTVPKGFITDFASIPRIFWSFLPRDGRYTYAAIVHDYLYWTQSTSRQEADLVLQRAMEDFAVDRMSLEAIVTAVRLGGGSAWDQNAKLKDAGEKRTLRVIPTDPTVSWESWKKNPSHF